MFSLLRILIMWFIFYEETYAQKIFYADIIEAYQQAILNTPDENLSEEYKKRSGSSYDDDIEKFFQLSKFQRLCEETTKILRNRFDLTSDEVLQLKNINLRKILSKETEMCLNIRGHIKCDEFYPYRKTDGSCNNLRHPMWGKSFECFQRLMHPVYSDGVSMMRKTISGNKLPIPRIGSLIIHPDVNFSSKYLTTHYMEFGQFHSHDLSSSSQPAAKRLPNPIDCCSSSETNERCSPLDVPPNDPFFSKFGVTCINNARTDICMTCSLGPRDQMNQQTSFIDLSVSYGATERRLNQLRAFDGTGTLKVTQSEAGEMLQQSINSTTDNCSYQIKNRKCFYSGDIRANQQTMITSYHLIFDREHNRIAKKLHLLNPTWDDEKLFQTARTILIAQYQMMVYNEYLPITIGKAAMEFFHLTIRKGVFYTNYDHDVNPTVLNEFGASALRFGHTNVGNIIPEIYNHTIIFARLKDMYQFPFDLFKKGFLEALIQGMSLGPSQIFNRFIAKDISNHLYQKREEIHGQDLTAFDIFRGIDHGLPPYVSVLRYCTGRFVKSFNDLNDVFREGHAEYYAKVFESVEDIGHFGASLSEKPLPGAVVGPTVACILGAQYNKLKYGDRFYFEHKNQLGSFTPNQILEIKKASLARLMCDNSNVRYLQKNIMLAPGPQNPIVSCNSIPAVDLSVF